MKKLICIFAAVMLVFAVSCSNDNPSPDASAPVINAPEYNTDFSSMSPEEQMSEFNKLNQMVNDAGGHEAFDMLWELESEASEAADSYKQSGTYSKTNRDGTIKVVFSFDFAEMIVSEIIYYVGYEYGDYTIWGIDESISREYTTNENKEFTLRDNTKETENITKIKTVSLIYVEAPENDVTECYLNGAKLDLTSQQ